MAVLAAPLLLLRRVPFVAPALRLVRLDELFLRLLVLAALRVFDAARLPRVAFGRPAFALAVLLARALLAFGRPADRLELAFTPRAPLRALAVLRPVLRADVLRADAVRGLRRRLAPDRLR